MVDSITPSPSPNRLRTNYVPSLLEAYQIRSALSQVDNEISKLDDVLAQLKVIQDRLLLKREMLQRFSKEHIGLLSPIRRLPPEILTEIFLYFSGGVLCCHRISANNGVVWHYSLPGFGLISS